MSDSDYRKIVSRLGKVLRRYLAFGIAEAFLTALAAWGCLILVVWLCESMLYLAPDVKTLLFFTALGTISAVFLFLVVLRILRRPGLDDLSRMVEKRYPFLGDRLISAVQLGRLGTTGLHGQSGDLVNALLGRVEEETRRLNLLQAVS